jgi:hypothetical protein
MADDSTALIAALGLGWLIGSSGKRQEVASNQQLAAYRQTWRPFTDRFIERRNTLLKYKLDRTIKVLSGNVQSAYQEAVKCFLFGQNLAASNMICLTLETLIRDITNDKESPFVKIIDDIVKKKNLSPDLQDELHQLRKIRNRHSHTVAKLKELTLLSLFQAVGDIIKELGYGR